MLESVNLSLSTACTANCIFCPSNRGHSIKQKSMSFNTAQKIIEEISSEEFKNHHHIKNMELGENGDAFLNKDFMKILRLIKLKLPNIQVVLHTNFQNFEKTMAEEMIRERLLSQIVCNIDGFNEQNYFHVKKLNFNKTWNNLKDFVRLRKELNNQVPIRILVLTLNNYIHTVHNNLGVYPIKLKNPKLKKVPDDFKLIKRQLDRILNPRIDSIIKSWVFAWAEREQIDTSKINYKRYACPNLIRLKRDAFIAPDGTWYACCLDSNYDLSLGNVLESSIQKIYDSEKRKQLIYLLTKKQFARIGGPCKTVNCCQIMNKNLLLSNIARIVQKNTLLMKIATKDASSISLE